MHYKGGFQRSRTAVPSLIEPSALLSTIIKFTKGRGRLIRSKRGIYRHPKKEKTLRSFSVARQLFKKGAQG
jgi:hypothetical protein